MRNTFLLWLFFFVAMAFGVTLYFSFTIQTEQARDNAIALIRLKMEDTKKQLRNSEITVQNIRAQTDAVALVKARALAQFIVWNPALLNDPAELERLRRNLDVDELHVSDEKGVLIASIPASYQGYDMASTQQSAAFMRCITDPNFELAQNPTRKGIDGEMFQYAGVARRDRPGIVQIGSLPQRFQEAVEVTNVTHLSAGLRIGSAGTVLIVGNGRILSSANTGDIGAGIGKYGVTPDLLKQDRNGYLASTIDEKFICVNESFDNYELVGVLPDNEMYINRNGIIFFLIISNLVLFGVVFVLVSELVQRVVINGIYKVNRSLAKIAAGDLDEKVEVRSSREFVLLSDGINSTVKALKCAIAEAAERLDAELRFAKAIQHSALPNIFPPYPDRTEFEIFASMDTAKEVGGDFYDFFPIDDNHLAIVIADVSDKGIPAALFMMTAKTLIKSLAESGLPPAELFNEANNRLCEHNEAGMFVTTFFGILELDSGKFVCVNAGHCLPLLKRAGGAYEFWKMKTGLVLAGMPGIRYRQFSIDLAPGDILCLYTDGVTEARNRDGELFGEKRLLDTVNTPETQKRNVVELLPYLRARLSAFAEGTEQADDITMLALEYKGAHQS